MISESNYHETPILNIISEDSYPKTNTIKMVLYPRCPEAHILTWFMKPAIHTKNVYNDFCTLRSRKNVFYKNKLKPAQSKSLYDDVSQPP